MEKTKNGDVKTTVPGKAALVKKVSNAKSQKTGKTVKVAKAPTGVAIKGTNGKVKGLKTGGSVKINHGAEIKIDLKALAGGKTTTGATGLHGGKTVTNKSGKVIQQEGSQKNQKVKKGQAIEAGIAIAVSAAQTTPTAKPQVKMAGLNHVAEHEKSSDDSQKSFGKEKSAITKAKGEFLKGISGKQSTNSGAPDLIRSKISAQSGIKERLSTSDAGKAQASEQQVGAKKVIQNNQAKTGENSRAALDNSHVRIGLRKDMVQGKADAKAQSTANNKLDRTILQTETTQQTSSSKFSKVAKESLGRSFVKANTSRQDSTTRLEKGVPNLVSKTKNQATSKSQVSSNRTGQLFVDTPSNKRSDRGLHSSEKQVTSQAQTRQKVVTNPTSIKQQVKNGPMPEVEKSDPRPSLKLRHRETSGFRQDSSIKEVKHTTEMQTEGGLKSARGKQLSTSNDRNQQIVTDHKSKNTGIQQVKTSQQPDDLKLHQAKNTGKKSVVLKGDLGSESLASKQTWGNVGQFESKKIVTSTSSRQVSQQGMEHKTMHQAADAKTIQQGTKTAKTAMEHKTIHQAVDPKTIQQGTETAKPAMEHKTTQHGTELQEGLVKSKTPENLKEAKLKVVESGRFPGEVQTAKEKGDFSHVNAAQTKVKNSPKSLRNREKEIFSQNKATAKGLTTNSGSDSLKKQVEGNGSLKGNTREIQNPTNLNAPVSTPNKSVLTEAGNAGVRGEIPVAQLSGDKPLQSDKKTTEVGAETKSHITPEGRANHEQNNAFGDLSKNGENAAKDENAKSEGINRRLRGKESNTSATNRRFEQNPPIDPSKSLWNPSQGGMKNASVESEMYLALQSEAESSGARHNLPSPGNYDPSESERRIGAARDALAAGRSGLVHIKDPVARHEVAMQLSSMSAELESLEQAVSAKKTSAQSTAAVYQQILSTVERFRAMSTNRWVMSIEPNQATQLRLELRMVDAQLVVQASVERGSQALLNSGWSDLQASLAEKDINLKSLLGGNNQGRSSLFDERERQSNSQEKADGDINDELAELMAELENSSSSTAGKVSSAKSVQANWESWA